MTLLWFAVVTLYLVVVVRSHGWEYTPLIAIVGVAVWLAATNGYTALAVVMTASLVGVVWFLIVRNRV